MAGQINLGSTLGDILRQLASNKGYTTALEIGTWNGLGSTLCLLQGAADRGAEWPLEIWSVEGNKDMAEAAKARVLEWWEMAKRGRVPADHPYKAVSDTWGKRLPVLCPLTVWWGRMAEDMMTIPQIMTHPLWERVADHYRLHYRDELHSIQTAPLLPFKKQFDIILLDGGEFSGEQDWAAVQKCSPKIVVLDDTAVMKNARVLEDAKRKGWVVVAEGADRNGWAILKSPAKID